MKTAPKIFSALLVAVVFTSCIHSKKNTRNTEETNTEPVLPEWYHEPYAYQPSETRAWDLLHMKTEVSVNWDSTFLYGKSVLTLVPYFYPQKNLTLDAKGFDINKVARIVKHNSSADTTALKYSYDGMKIDITADKEYPHGDTIMVFIDYVAKPNRKKEENANAVAGDKGLYFINPDGKNLYKPRELWTQGETEYNSGWFPTIDRPNERCTGELFITMENDFVTLSNGRMVYSVNNKDGSRTDYWRQDLPIAPYLYVMVAGPYAVVKDTWRGKEVNYYVEKEYEPYAKLIFGNTPEMLEFFSNVLGVEYPWAKFSQIVVRDFIAGAMENVSAVVHFSMLQHDDREHLDNPLEDIISHELFHHWFGDYVTCESWSNVPLNESFATYGEYLWNEHKYGKDVADIFLEDDLQSYLGESEYKREPIIRYRYEDREDMFDAHSYQKGGRVLHMLRKYIGDKGFFASLKLYLDRNKFTAVEINDLRKAFEDVTGEDLNWFFNQWFLSPGHPELNITYGYYEDSKQATVNVSQMQNDKYIPVYKLPLKIDVYHNGKAERYSVTVDSKDTTFTFPSPEYSGRPDWMSFDAEKILLAEITENKNTEEWLHQLNESPLFKDKYDALQNLSVFLGDSVVTASIMKKITDTNFSIRKQAVQKFYGYSGPELQAVSKLLAERLSADEKSTVRVSALNVLISLKDIDNPDEELKSAIQTALKDKSYSVFSTALKTLNKYDAETAYAMAKENANLKSGRVTGVISGILAEKGKPDDYDYFKNTLPKAGGFGFNGGLDFFTNYAKFVSKQDSAIKTQGIGDLKEIVKDKNQGFIVRWGAFSGLHKYLSDSDDVLAFLKQSAEEEDNATLKAIWGSELRE